MSLNSTGKLSLGGDVVGESVNLELGLVAGAANSMVSSTNQLLTGKATGPWVFPDDWRGKTNVILAFGNSDTFDVRQSQPNTSAFALLGFAQDGSVSKIGNITSQGPNSWSYPIGSPGSDYEIRLIVDTVDTLSSAFSSFSFAGVNVPAPATTGYNNLGSPGAGSLAILSGVNRTSSASGTVEIRRVGFGTPMISRAFYILAAGLNYNETVTSSSYSVKVGDTHSISIAGGVPNTVVRTFKHPTNFPIGARQEYTLDSSGNYTITAVQYATASSWQWDFYFVATEATRTFNVAVAPAYSPTITLQDSFVGTQTISWSVASGPPNGTYSYEFRDVPGVYTSGTGTLNASGAAAISTELGPPEDTNSFQLTVTFFDSSGTQTNVVTDSISWSAPVPTYSVTTATSSVNEGGSITYTVNTTNVANGTNLSWAVSSFSDFTEPTGTFAINNNTGQFVLTATADATTEGSETFTVNIYAGMTLVGTFGNSTTINDTSTTPAPTPTYAFGAYSTSVNEGGTITFTVNTTNIANGTNLSWAVSSFSDFTEPTGTFAISNNTGTFALTATADATTEGSETFTVGIYAGITLVLTSNAITINDTSTTPAASATYSWGSYPTTINEGLSNFGRFYVNTTNVPDGTQFKWRTVGLAAADSPTLAGQFGIYSNAGDFSVSIDADNLTEGAETFYVEVTNFAGTVVLLTSNTVTINDTSTTPPANPAAGTVLSQGCVSGTYTYRVTKADGSGGSYNEDTANSATCGYVAPSLNRYDANNYWVMQIDSQPDFGTNSYSGVAYAYWDGVAVTSISFGTNGGAAPDFLIGQSAAGTGGTYEVGAYVTDSAALGGYVYRIIKQ